MKEIFNCKPLFYNCQNSDRKNNGRPSQTRIVNRWEYNIRKNCIECDRETFLRRSVISDFRCRINMDFPCLRSSEKRNLLREYFFARERRRWRRVFRISLAARESARASSHNKFRCGISERIAKLATTGFPREKLSRHVISFIARHVHAVLREIFTTISGRNWYCDSPFVTLHIMYVPHVRFSYDVYEDMTRACVINFAK